MENRKLFKNTLEYLIDKLSLIKENESRKRILKASFKDNSTF